MTDIEMIRQIRETKLENIKDFKNELMKRLKNDDRTVIYFNLLCMVDEIAMDIINEIERGY